MSFLDIVDNFSLYPPLPRPEMESYVKGNMNYDAICEKIRTGSFGKSTVLLDRIVRMVVDLQYADGEFEIGKERLCAEEVAHQLLQLRQYQVEYVLSSIRYNYGNTKEITDSTLREIMYNAVESIGAYRYAARHKLRTGTGKRGEI